MVVVITGVSRGIGRELLGFFLQKGCKVIAVSSNDANIKPQNGLSIVKADFSKTEEVFDAAREIKKITGTVSVLINNAASIIVKPFEQMLPADFEHIYKINTEAPYFFTQQLLPLMGKEKTAHIVNISSMGGFMGSSKFAGLSVYSSSKGALSIMTECLAEELKEKNVKANCLCLGAVNTEMLKQAFPGYEAQTHPKQMAEFIGDFALNGHNYFNGKVLPVSISTP